MPTLIEDATQPHKTNSYFPHHGPGRPKGSKNYVPRVQIRRELEKVYQLMGSEQGLWAWAQTDEGKSKFYELFCKIYATWEIKQDVSAGEPIRVIVYGKDGQTMEITQGQPVMSLPNETETE